MIKHIHEILINIQDTNRDFADKKEFVEYVESVFGKDCIFNACSADGMNADMAYDFLMNREKIVINQQNRVTLHPSMTMCDGHKHH